jgi:hypothetical protein
MFRDFDARLISRTLRNMSIRGRRWTEVEPRPNFPQGRGGLDHGEREGGDDESNPCQLLPAADVQRERPRE